MVKKKSVSDVQFFFALGGYFSCDTYTCFDVKASAYFSSNSTSWPSSHPPKIVVCSSFAILAIFIHGELDQNLNDGTVKLRAIPFI